MAFLFQIGLPPTVTPRPPQGQNQGSITDRTQQEVAQHVQEIDNFVDSLVPRRSTAPTDYHREIQECMQGVDSFISSLTPAPSASPPSDYRQEIRECMQGVDGFIAEIAQLPPGAPSTPFDYRREIQEHNNEIDRFINEMIQSQAAQPLPGQNTGQPDINRYGQALGCTFQKNADGTYTRVIIGGSDTSTYLPQPDGTLRRTTGQLTLPGQAPQNLAEATLYFDGAGNLREDAAAAISPYTRPLQRLGATSNGDGTFRITNGGTNIQRAMLIPNLPPAGGAGGRPVLFATGGVQNGVILSGPSFYVVTNPATGEGNWVAASTIARPDFLSRGAQTAANAGMIPDRSGTNLLPISGRQNGLAFGTFTPRSDGGITWSGGQDPQTNLHYPRLHSYYDSATNRNKFWVFTGGDWRELEVRPMPGRPGQTEYFYRLPAAGGNPARIVVYNHGNGTWGAPLPAP